jgi:hypothetical protein
LTLHPQLTGSQEYLATAYPLKGAVPAGQTVASDDDASLRAAVVSTWPDGSARIAVLAGRYSFGSLSPVTVRLKATPGLQTPLTAARVGQLLSSISVTSNNFGNATISDFSIAAPSATRWVWWASERMICCRYRVPFSGSSQLEAVIDIHAFDTSRAFVEVVIENGLVNPSSPSKPSSKAYTATLNITPAGGTQTAIGSAVTTTLNSTHEAFRAWYRAGWVSGSTATAEAGAADPRVEVAHDIASMQAHPAFFRLWKAAPSMAMYASDAYAPWSLGRMTNSMGATGDDDTIGALPIWEVQYLQSGAKEARRACIAQTLSQLCYAISHRSSLTGRVVSSAELAGRGEQGGSWPTTDTTPDWKISHHPAGGLLAFMLRPSPVFLEICQKIGTKTAQFNPGQVRSKAWAIRSRAHAAFITPSSEAAYKSAAETLLLSSVTDCENRYIKDSNNKLNVMYDYGPGDMIDVWDTAAGTQQPIWEHHYFAGEAHKAASSELLTGTAQTRINAMADWAASQAVRYVTEASGGSWRVHDYVVTMSQTTGTLTQPATWGEMYNWSVANAGDVAQPSSSGQWVNRAGAPYTTTNPVSRPAYFWPALVSGVERGLPGADAAWTTVTTGITNLSTWSNVFTNDPRWGWYPRNK